MKKRGALDVISLVVLIVIVLLVIWFLIRIIAGSLGFEELVVGLLIANLGYSFYINTKLSGHIGWHKGQDSKRKS